MTVKSAIFLLLCASVFFLAGCSVPPGSNSDDEPAYEALITAFSFGADQSSKLSEDIVADIAGFDIAAVIPWGVDVTAIAPTFTISEHATVSPALDTAQDFSSDVTYTVTSKDGLIVNNYIVSISRVVSIDPVLPTDGLLAFYEFCGNLTDSSGNGNDGATETTDPVYSEDRFGTAGSSYRVAFQDTCITTTTDYGTDTFTEVSISLWFKQAYLNKGVLFGETDVQDGSSTNGDLRIYMDDNGIIRFGEDTSGTIYEVSTMTNYNTGTWHNVIAICYTDRLEMYINGNAEHIISGVYTPTPELNYLIIGYSNMTTPWSDIPSTLYFLDGYIDDVMVYDRALTADEITAISSNN